MRLHGQQKECPPLKCGDNREWGCFRTSVKEKTGGYISYFPVLAEGRGVRAWSKRGLRTKHQYDELPLSFHHYQEMTASH